MLFNKKKDLFPRGPRGPLRHPQKKLSSVIETKATVRDPGIGSPGTLLQVSVPVKNTIRS